MAQVLVPLQRLDRGARRGLVDPGTEVRLVEFPAFSLDDISFDDAPLLEEKAPPAGNAPAPPPPASAAERTAAPAAAAVTDAPVPGPVAASTSGIAYITVA